MRLERVGWVTAVDVWGRGGLGIELLTQPGRITRGLVTGGDPRRVLLLAKALGARHVAESALLAYKQDLRLRRAVAAVDLTHAASMVALAACSARYRRIALASAVVAGAMAAAGSVAGRRPTRTAR